MRLGRWLCGLVIAGGLLGTLYFIAGARIDHAMFHSHILQGTKLGVVRHPRAPDLSRMMSSIPAYDPGNPGTIGQMDLRSADLSSADITGRENDLLHADFDSKTKWPAGLTNLSLFKPDRIMELGRNPGLAVRSLHEKGITGKGVGIAIIDESLLVEHVEYKDRLKLYEEIHCLDDGAQMHGSALASIAVGKTVGVAPGADLYYIAETSMKLNPGTYYLGLVSRRGLSDENHLDFRPLARSIDRVVEINKNLPRDHKIRVIAISREWVPFQKGGGAADEAIERAEKEGIFVINTSYGSRLNFMGLGREPLLDPDQLASYGPGLFWARGFFQTGRVNVRGQEALLVPMDSRCTASATGTNDYVFNQSGGLGSATPYVAGLYALACQVKPKVTPEEFWSVALSTGDTVQIEHGGRKHALGKVVNPQKLIDRLEK